MSEVIARTHLQALSIRDLLKDYFRPRKVEYKCPEPGCKCNSAWATFRWSTVPEVLVLHVKRFYYRKTTAAPPKLAAQPLSSSSSSLASSSAAAATHPPALGAGVSAYAQAARKPSTATPSLLAVSMGASSAAAPTSSQKAGLPGSSNISTSTSTRPKPAAAPAVTFFYEKLSHMVQLTPSLNLQGHCHPSKVSLAPHGMR